MNILINQYSEMEPIYHNRFYNVYAVRKDNNVNRWYVSPEDTKEYGVTYESTDYHYAQVLMCMHCSSIIACIEFIEAELRAKGIDPLVKEERRSIRDIWPL